MFADICLALNISYYAEIKSDDVDRCAQNVSSAIPIIPTQEVRKLRLAEVKRPVGTLPQCDRTGSPPRYFQERGCFSLSFLDFLAW